MSATNKSESVGDLDCGATPDFASILVCETLIRILMKLERMEEWQMLSHILILLKGYSWTIDDGIQYHGSVVPLSRFLNINVPHN